MVYDKLWCDQAKLVRSRANAFSIFLLRLYTLFAELHGITLEYSTHPNPNTNPNPNPNPNLNPYPNPNPNPNPNLTLTNPNPNPYPNPKVGRVHGLKLCQLHFAESPIETGHLVPAGTIE